MHYAIPSEIMDEIARLTPTFAGVSYEKLDRLGSVQWPCNDKAPEGTPIMHVGRLRARQGPLHDHRVRAHRRDALTARFPLLLTTGRILSQYNVGAQTRRTANVAWHGEDLLEIHPHDAENRGINDGDWWRSPAARAKRRCARSSPNACSPASSTRPSTSRRTGANVVTTEFSDWATNCPEYKVTAVQVRKANSPSDWQRHYAETRELTTQVDHAN